MHRLKKMETDSSFEREETITGLSPIEGGTPERITPSNAANKLREDYKEVRARRIKRMQKRRQNCFTGILCIPTSTSLIHILIGILLVVLFVWMKFRCGMKSPVFEKLTGTKDNSKNTIIGNDNGTDSDDGCSNLESHYPFPSVELLLTFMVLGGMVRLIIMTFLHCKIQKNSEVKNMGKYILLSSLITTATGLFVKFAYNPEQHEEDPHNPDDQMYRFCQILSRVVWFCFADGLTTVFSFVFLEICKSSCCCYIDPMPELMIELDDIGDLEANHGGVPVQPTGLNFPD